MEPEEPEIPAEPETPTEPEEPEISEKPETPTEPDNGSDEETKPIAPSPSVPQTGWNPQVLPVTGNQKERFLEEFTPSERLIPKVLRIKYSTDMPLENIPPFITTEMITGALKVQDEYGYPASVTIAQVIQESGFGKYGPYGEKGQGLSYLAFQYNNLFRSQRDRAGRVCSDENRGRNRRREKLYHSGRIPDVPYIQRKYGGQGKTFEGSI